MSILVQCLSGEELTLELPPLTVRVGVADVKRHALAELLRLRSRGDAESKKEEIEEESDAALLHSKAVEEKMAVSYLAFRGQLLADADDINVFALTPTDFFVLIEEDSDDAESQTEADSDEEETKSSYAEDVPKARKRRKTGVAESKRCSHGNAVVSQLVEMGFSKEQARSAAEIANGDLQRALALLMGEPDTSEINNDRERRLRDFVARLIRRYPELATIESLLMNEEIHHVKNRNLTNTFEALMMLKESAPSYILTQMNENPVETLVFLAVPEMFEFETPDASQSNGAKFSPTSHPRDEIDLPTKTSNGGIPREKNDEEAIARLTAMGFAIDVVETIYESCGGNEELAANLLFETLE